MKTETISYQEGGVEFEGYAAFDSSREGKLPAVLIFHAFGGLEDSERDAAARIAKLGYVGFAADVYGKGKRASNGMDPSALMNEIVSDRAKLQRRLMASISAAANHPKVDSTRIAAIGFCFGGLCSLDVARSGTDKVRGVVSLHGVFHASGLPAAAIKTKVLVLHGFDDPMAKPDEMIALGNELKAGGADWQIHAFGNTMHGFTRQSANNPSGGVQYNETSAKRSWKMVDNFLEEIF